jgi:hypothetical protein
LQLHSACDTERFAFPLEAIVAPPMPVAGRLPIPPARQSLMLLFGPDQHRVPRIRECRPLELGAFRSRMAALLHKG